VARRRAFFLPAGSASARSRHRRIHSYGQFRPTSAASRETSSAPGTIPPATLSLSFACVCPRKRPRVRASGSPDLGPALPSKIPPTWNADSPLVCTRRTRPRPLQHKAVASVMHSSPAACFFFASSGSMLRTRPITDGPRWVRVLQPASASPKLGGRRRSPAFPTLVGASMPAATRPKPSA